MNILLMLLPHLILLTIAALVIYAFWRPSPVAAAISGLLTGVFVASLLPA